jgi:hypothetical protein
VTEKGTKKPEIKQQIDGWSKSQEFLSAAKNAAEMHAKMQTQMSALANAVQKNISRITRFNFSSFVTAPELVNSLNKTFQSISKLFANSEKAQKVLDSGWVPYAGMPLELLPNDATIQEAGIFAQNIIDNDWLEVRACLIDTVRKSGVDQEAIDTFEEALEAFQCGHYRSVVRVLFPEIERIARENVYGGSRHDRPSRQHPKKKRMNTNMHGLREALMEELPAGLALHSNLGFALTMKMHEHLYEWVGADEESLAKFRDDPVPNRHASQHGFVSYSSRQNAFNALSMTAFMFDCVMRTSRYLVQNTADDNAAAS